MKHKPKLIHHEDSFCAVYKPSGWLSIPDRLGNTQFAVSHWLGQKIQAPVWPLHRLDRDTSGILLFALDKQTHSVLNQCFEERIVKKHYVALVNGTPYEDEFSCSAPLISGVGKDSLTKVNVEKGKPSHTDFSVQQRFKKLSLLNAFPSSGRTHQIRVHLADLGFPILSDPLYGNGKPLFLSSIKRGYKGSAQEKALLSRLALHAFSLHFPHPITQEPIQLRCEWPKDIRAAVLQLSKHQ